MKMKKNNRRYRGRDLNRYYDLRYKLENRERILTNTREKNRNDPFNRMRTKFYGSAKARGIRPRRLTKEYVLLMVERERKGCACCGSKDRLHLDHIVPVRQRGDFYDSKNIQFLCEVCHKEKTQQENYERLKREFVELEQKLIAKGLIRRLYKPKTQKTW